MLNMFICSMLDPSCSGSGIVNRWDFLVEGKGYSSSCFDIIQQIANTDSASDEDEERIAERLERLSSFQGRMIEHAMKCA